MLRGFWYMPRRVGCAIIGCARAYPSMCAALRMSRYLHDAVALSAMACDVALATCRAGPLIEIRQTAPCRAIRGNRISASSQRGLALNLRPRQGGRCRRTGFVRGGTLMVPGTRSALRAAKKRGSSKACTACTYLRSTCATACVVYI